MVRHAKRGFLVEVAGAEPPQVYPCLTASDIGEAIVEILEDPDREEVQFTAPEPEAPEEAPRKKQAAQEVEEEEEDGDYEGGSDYHPAGWSAADELALKFFGAVTDKARKISSWRQED
jgi:hypothetical protein